MNAYDVAPKGMTYQHTLIRVRTDAGVEGIAPGSYANLSATDYAQELRPLIGCRLEELYTVSAGRVTGRQDRFSALLSQNRHLDCAFYDIMGKLHNKPVWALIGDQGKQEIPVYDGTIYFSDVLHPDRGIKAVTDECVEAMSAGYSGVKIKLGRGSKWMPEGPGDHRDIEIVHAVRGTIGEERTLMADPNYGYRGRYDKALALMRAIKNDRLFWIEEIFPETVEIYTQFRHDLAQEGNPCRIAFGEHMATIPASEPYLRPNQLIDVVQQDIRRCGFLDSAAVAKQCAQYGAKVAPHNWASQMGHIMDLHLARAIPNHSVSESDRSVCDVLRTEPLSLKDGCVTAPARAGLGIEIDETIYRAKHAAGEIIIH